MSDTISYFMANLVIEPIFIIDVKFGDIPIPIPISIPIYDKYIGF